MWGKLTIVLCVCALVSGCMSQSKVIFKSLDSNNKTTIASFPTELRGAYIRKSQPVVQQKVKLILTDEKGNMATDKNGMIQTVEVDRTYFNSILSICAEPPADTGASSSLSLAGSLSNQLAANNAATASLTNAINNINANERSNAGERSLSRVDGEDSDTSTRSVSGSSSSNLDQSRTRSAESSLTNSASNNLAVQANLNLTREVVELQGRTQLVLLAREFMYRNCEAAANGYISREDFLTLHKASINQVSEMLKASVSKAEAQKKEADAKATKAETDKLKAEAERLKALNKTSDTNYQSQVKFAKDQLLKCIKAAGSDSTKTKACNTEFEKNIVKK